MQLGFPGGSVVKTPPANAGDEVRFLGWEDIWRRKWQPAPVSCLGNPMDRGGWWAIVHGVAKGLIQLSNYTYSISKKLIKNLKCIIFHFCTFLPNASTVALHKM